MNQDIKTSRTIQVFFQGMDRGLRRATGSCEEMDLGHVRIEKLELYLKRMMLLTAPRGKGACPPRIATSGPAGALHFVVDKDRLYCEEKKRHVYPFEAVRIILGGEGGASAAPSKQEDSSGGRPNGQDDESVPVTGFYKTISNILAGGVLAVGAGGAFALLRTAAGGLEYARAAGVGLAALAASLGLRRLIRTLNLQPLPEAVRPAIETPVASTAAPRARVKPIALPEVETAIRGEYLFPLFSDMKNA